MRRFYRRSFPVVLSVTQNTSRAVNSPEETRSRKHFRRTVARWRCQALRKDGSEHGPSRLRGQLSTTTE